MGWSRLKEAFSSRYVRATIVKDNGQIVQKTALYDEKNTFIVGNCAYVVDVESIRYEKNKPYAFYFEGNPYPVHFNSAVFNVEIRSGNLKDILNSKVIQEMVQGKNENLLLYALIAVNIIIGIILIAKEFGIIEVK